MPKNTIKLDIFQEQKVRETQASREFFAEEQIKEKIEQLATETDPKLVMLGIIRLVDSFSHKWFRSELVDALIRELKVIALPPEEREEYMEQQEKSDAELAVIESIFEAARRKERRQAYINSLSGFSLTLEEDKLSKHARELRESIEACTNEEEQERLNDELAEVEGEIGLCQTIWKRSMRKRR